MRSGLRHAEVQGAQYARVRVIRGWFSVEGREHDSLSPQGSSPYAEVQRVL